MAYRATSTLLTLVLGLVVLPAAAQDMPKRKSGASCPNRCMASS